MAMNLDERREEQFRRVHAFAASMVDRLDDRADDPDKSFLGWENTDFHGLFVHLVEEVGEVAKALRDPDFATVFLECVDVANLAFMLSDAVVTQDDDLSKLPTQQKPTAESMEEIDGS